jgi:regulator of replication initiation timing
MFTEIPNIFWSDAGMRNMAPRERAVRFLALCNSLLPTYLGNLDRCLMNISEQYNELGFDHQYDSFGFERKVVQEIVPRNYKTDLDVSSIRSIFKIFFAELLSEAGIVIVPHAKSVIDPDKRSDKKISHNINAFKKALVVKSESTITMLRMSLKDSTREISSEKMQMNKMREAATQLAMKVSKLEFENDMLKKRLSQKVEPIQEIAPRGVPSVLPVPPGYGNITPVQQNLSESLDDYSRVEMYLDSFDAGSSN